MFKINIDGGYYIFLIIVSSITIIFALKEIVTKKQIPIALMILVAITGFVTISYLITDYKYDRLPLNNFILFLIWAVPASVCGIYFRKITKRKVIQFFKAIFFLFSISLILIVLIPYLLGTLPTYINFGLMNYQNISYISSFTMGLGIYFISDKLVKHKLMYLILIFTLLPVIFIAGGRGGAVLFILYIIVTMISMLIGKKTSLVKKISINFSIIILSAIAILIFIKSGNTRTFSYISSNGLTFEGTSGRGDIYALAILYIKEHLLTGYGLFNYYHLIDNIPHNLILEILLAFGIIGFIFILLFVSVLIYKFIKYFDTEGLDKLIIYIGLYPFVLLMFSSNFLVVSEFWFVLFYLISKSKRIMNYEKT